MTAKQNLYNQDADRITKGNLDAARLSQGGIWELTSDLTIRDDAGTPNDILTIDEDGLQVGFFPGGTSKKVYVGADTEYLQYDGTDLEIGSSNDLLINCGTQKTMELQEIVWDDLRFPAFGRNVDISSGRVDFNYTDMGIDYAYNTRYDQAEQVSFIVQMPHTKKMDTDVDIHLHWAQVKNYIPNIMIEYRWYHNGDDISALAFSTMISDDDMTHTFTYTSGTLIQISSFTNVSPPTNETISSILEIKLFRDALNTSGLFDVAEPYNTGGDTSWLLKELDVHYQVNTMGSRMEFVK